VFNKGYLLESLDASFAQSRVQGKPCSVIYFDLDFFKKVNDTHGHSCGDFILREAAQLAKSCMRSEDVVGRYGGEEFVVVLSDCDVRLAAALAERLRKAMESHDFVYGGKSLKQTVSIGVSEIRSDFASPRELLDNADQKLYQSKHSGRNRVTV
jgi:diguanylate cyclase (GGDEF)-like protein